MNEILQRNEEHEETDRALFQNKTARTPAQWWRDFKKYHGLSRSDVQFFNTSKKLIDLASRNHMLSWEDMRIIFLLRTTFLI